MITKVIIKRQILEGSENDFFSILRNLRFSAMDQEGYISGETLICADQTNKVLIISKWESMEHWKAWEKSEARKKIDKMLSAVQEKSTEYEAYVFSKFRAAAVQGFPPPLQHQE
ncbi:MAG: antibiotic biosynthesis monooxygenase [Desulfobacteraceae bacterium]|nr:antibiotic biosynthesis monooxygenase [Desulfobacteraceae bacterium]